MYFKYFQQPQKHGDYLPLPTVCSICGQEKKCFDATAFYGEDKIAAICEDCLSGGALRERDIFTCEGDIEELQRQLWATHPRVSPAAILKRSGEITDDLERTTPHLITWQHWYWPCVGGDYCTFLGFGSKALYDALAPDGDGEEFFKNSMYRSVEDLSDVDELWEEYLPDEAVDSLEVSRQFTTLFYVFRSQKGEQIVTLWDVA